MGLEDYNTEELFWELHNSEPSSWKQHSTIFKDDEDVQIEGEISSKKIVGKANDVHKSQVIIKDTQIEDICSYMR